LAWAEPGAYNVRWEHNNTSSAPSLYTLIMAVTFDKMDYPATEGLLQLLTRKNPKYYNKDNLQNYGNILDKSDVIYLGWNRPIDKNSAKWKNIFRPIWKQLNLKRAKSADYKKAQRQTGKGIIFLPSNPNVLVKRLQLLLSNVQSGNTGIVQNEIVAILDELLRLKHIDHEEYKSILSRV